MKFTGNNVTLDKFVKLLGKVKSCPECKADKKSIILAKQEVDFSKASDKLAVIFQCKSCDNQWPVFLR